MEKSDGRKLFPPQLDVINAGLLEDQRHLLLNMATGSGKTFLAELAIDRVVKSGYKAVYLTPLKALATQQQRAWESRFQQMKIGVFTGDTAQAAGSKYSYHEAQILIMTPERMDMCLRSWRKYWSWIPEINLIVIDEFHLLGQGVRGARLEGSITRLIRLNPFMRLIGLSATMPNADELSNWLCGLYYQSKWRQVPLKKRFVRFKSAKDKPNHLLKEVFRCIQEGGQSLIFCNSRRRTEDVAKYLKEQGIPAACQHAGLMPEQREQIEADFRSGAIRALAATSTLEMGLNMPARQVILYDSSIFTEYGFDDLPVWSYIQRAGRAGRPGRDPIGEVVMILPRWVSIDPYESERCEPIQSQIGGHRYIQEQLLIEVYAGYSRTAQELTEGFLPLTLYRAQHSEASISRTINELLLGDLLYETECESNVQDRPLKVGLLGTLAIRLMFTVDTVRIVKTFHDEGKRLYLFDLLLIATLSEECEPVLRANYEEIDSLCEIVQLLPSAILDLSVEKLHQKLPSHLVTTRILAAIKMAAVCHCLTTEMTQEEIARRFMVYTADVHLLRESIIRAMQGITAIFTAIDHKGQDTDKALEKNGIDSPAVLAEMLTTMLRYRLNSELVSLTQLRGIGGQRAKALAGEGFDIIESIAGAEPCALKRIEGIGKKLSEQLVREAKTLCAEGTIIIYREEPVFVKLKTSKVKSKIDPYRLIRSRELALMGQEDDRFYVRGGREDHVIIRSGDGFTCDCMDYQEKGGQCKHILSYHYAQEMKKRPNMPMFIDSGGFASLFEGSELIERPECAMIKTKDGDTITPADVLSFQEDHADLGATLDFIITPGMDQAEAERRQELTIRNALFAKERHRGDMVLYASLQCWDESSAALCAELYANTGFRGIAIGGMVPRAGNPEYIERIVHAVSEAVPQCAIHVFGCGNVKLIPDLIRAGADSLDSSSYVREAVDARANRKRYGVHAGLYASILNLYEVNAAVTGKLPNIMQEIPNTRLFERLQ